MTETILIIDDTEVNRYTFGRLLQRVGYATREASTIRDGLDILEAHAIDLIILDVQLPDGNGFDTCVSLKATPNLASIPVLMTSASFIEGRDRALGFDCGAEGYLTTPIDALELTATVKALLRVKAAEQALKAALEKAEMASNAKTDFLANMSHEIRTPMNAIVGLTTLLGRSELTAQQRKFVSTLQQSAASLTALLNDLLDVAKIEDNKIVLEEIDFSLSDVIERVVEIATVGTEGKAVEVAYHRGEPLSDAYRGDPQRIHQVLLNLMSNAVKFTTKGSVIVAACDTVMDDGTAWVTMTVTDTGIGISAQKIDQVFEKFVQADSSTTRRFGGSGLGLSIARSLAELMGGRLSATSHVGEGSIFTLALPLKPAQSAVSLAEDTASHHRPAPGEFKVLVVEDNQANLIVATGFLDGLGFASATATSGAEALERLQQQAFDLILMDIQMEGMDGLETTRHIRAWESKQGRVRLPIIAMTAYGLAGDRERFIAAGMDDYLAKPIDAAKFENLLERYAVQSRGPGG